MQTTTLQHYEIDGLIFRAEDCVEGHLINPQLPKAFDDTPNEERSRLEMAMWWGRPFITIDTWEGLERHTVSWQAMLRAEGKEYATAEADMPARLAKDKASWFASYPDGKRFSVRCLDGGAWDRSTNWGAFPTLDEAIEVATNGPVWRRQE